MSAKTFLLAAKATSIPEASGLMWAIKKVRTTKDLTVKKDDKFVRLPAGCYTKLWRYTEANPYDMGAGEVVMEDTDYELRTHLQFMMMAYGHVLITGLGLGCVARGTLANPRVRSVTVIERDKEVLSMVAPHMPSDIKVVRADALDYIRDTDQQYQCVWHDVWTDQDAGEPHLAVKHMELITETVRICSGFQGAWAFPRYYRRLMKTDAKMI